MALNFKVSPEKAKALMDKLEQLSIKEADVQEKFVRSGGPGGQNVNKVSTCVYLKHLPTGIEVKMARERSQGLNRFLAWRQLVDKIEAEAEGRNSREQQLIEKIRRQKRKRSKRAQEKVLQAKHLQAEKKAARKPVGEGNGA